MTDEQFNAYLGFRTAVEDWALDHPELIRHPNSLVNLLANYVFKDLLDLEIDE